jgi:hypothetical protein
VQASESRNFVPSGAEYRLSTGAGESKERGNSVVRLLQNFPLKWALTTEPALQRRFMTMRR